MELTKRGTAEMSEHIDPVASKKIRDDSFVDDITTGGTKEVCERLKGNMDPDTCACDGTIPQILETGGFLIKAMGIRGGQNIKKFGMN